MAVLPLVGRRIPIVADDYSDPRRARRGEDHARARFQRLRGRQAAQAAADQHLRRRSATRLDRQRSVPGRARASDDLDAVLALHGLDRFTARKRIVAMMEERGFVDKIEPHTHTVPHGDRSGVVIEPWLTDQWYVDAKTLAQPALDAVRERTHPVRPEELGEDLFRLAREHRALVRFAPALVGAPDPGLVRAGRRRLRPKRGGSARTPGRAADTDGEASRRCAAGRRRARHLVLLGAVAVLDARLAGQDAGAASATIRPTCSSPASTSSSSGSPG